MERPPAAWTTPCDIHMMRTSCQASPSNLDLLSDALAVMADMAATDPAHLHVKRRVHGCFEDDPGDSSPAFQIELEIHDGTVRVSHRIGYNRSQLVGMDLGTDILPTVTDRASALRVVGLVAETWIAHLPNARRALGEERFGSPHSQHARRIATALHLAELNPYRLDVCAPCPWSPLAYAESDETVDALWAGEPIDSGIWGVISGGPDQPSGLILNFQRYMAQDSYLLAPPYGSVSRGTGAVEAVSWVRGILEHRSRGSEQ